MRQRGLRDGNRAVEIDVDQLPPLVDVEFVERAGQFHPRVVHDDVDFAELVQAVVDGPLDVARLGDIARR